MDSATATTLHTGDMVAEDLGGTPRRYRHVPIRSIKVGLIAGPHYRYGDQDLTSYQIVQVAPCAPWSDYHDAAECPSCTGSCTGGEPFTLATAGRILGA